MEFEHIQSRGLPELSRRRLLQVAVGAGAAATSMALLSACRDSNGRSGSDAINAPPETTRIALARTANLCFAPQYVAEQFLRAEGFTDISYHKTEQGDPLSSLLAAGDVHLAQDLITNQVIHIDNGDPIVVTGGLHSGCNEMFGVDGVRSVRDLKGKTVGVLPGGGAKLWVSTFAAYVGIDPRRDLSWVEGAPDELTRLLSTGEIDACNALPPFAQQLQAQGVGHVIMDTGKDRPWSQYFCCVLVGNREWVHRNPIATKRAMRAMYKAAELCAGSPDDTARFLEDGGYTTQQAFAAQAMRDIPYNRWRDFDVEDTVRFFALRMKEIGAVKNSPTDIIKMGTDTRFFNELKKELKA